MPISRFSLSALILLLAGVSYLSYEIVRPFLSSLVWAVLLAVIFYPVYLFFHKYVRSGNLASLIAVTIVLLVILGPFTYLLYLLLAEIISVSSYFQNTNFEPQKLLEYPMIRPLVDMFFPFFGLTEREVSEAIRSNSALLGKKVLAQIPKGAENLFHALFDFIIAAIALYFLFIHGSEIGDKLLAYLPFSKKNRENLKDQVKKIVTLTIYGGLASGLGHGILGAVAFAIIRIPSPLLLGLGVALTSFLPFVGSLLIYGPAILYLIIQGEIGRAVLLGAIAGIGSILIDYILRPLFIARRKMPFILIFFGMLGGVNFFGLKGLVLGPLVLAIFLALLNLARDMEDEMRSKRTAEVKDKAR